MLQFYKTISEANEKSQCELTPMIMPLGVLLPFQMIVPWSDSQVDRVRLLSESGSIVDASIHTITKRRTNNKDVHIVTRENSPWGVSVECGCYRLIVEMDNSDIWYSNKFRYVDFTEATSPFVKIKWTNDCSIPPYVYESGWIGEMYLDSDILVPEYQDIDEVQVDSNQNETTVSRVSKKIRKLEVVNGNEPLLDTFRWILLNDSIEITTPVENGDSTTYDVIDISIDEPEWNEEAASFLVSFGVDDNITKNKCCESICHTPKFTVDEFRYDSELSGLSPSEGDYYFISKVTSDDNEWTEHAGEVAYYNGSSYDYFYVPPNSFVLSSGSLFFVNPEGTPVASNGFTAVPAYVTTDKLYGVIPPNQMVNINGVYFSYDDIFNGIDSSDVGSGSHTATCLDPNGCGTWSELGVSVTVP